MNHDLLTLYQELVSPFVGSDLAESIRRAKDDKDYEALTCVPAFVGEEYTKQEAVRLMLIGRAVNGWDADWGTSVEEVAQQAMDIYFPMSNIDAPQPLKQGTPDEYNFNQSAFMRLGKMVGKGLGLEGEKVASKLMWSNLYKVAPAISGNPSGQIQKKQRQAAIKILQKEIEIYKPTHILFVTDLDWLQATWWNSKTEQSFADAFGITENSILECHEHVKAVGTYEGISYVVCVRPEARDAEKICDDVLKAFQGI